MKKLCIGLAVVLSLCLSTKSYAQDHDDHKDESKRYYDSQHKDYHTWNDDEDKKYHEYLSDNHKKDHDWKSASKKEQNDYWAWRHSH